MKPVTSDIESNKIITGVKFVKKNRIIQIEIEQSETMPEGIINDTNRTWIENSENLSIEDPDVYEMSYENRALDIDMLEAPPGTISFGYMHPTTWVLVLKKFVKNTKMIFGT